MTRSAIFLRTVTAVLVLGTTALVAHAQPAASGQQPVRIIVGFTPGGILDILARLTAEKLRVSLNTQVVVENRPGASTMLAMDVVKRSAPDGRTIIFNTPSPFTIFPYTYQKLNFDPERDFVAVSQLVTYPLVLSAGTNAPYKNFDDYRRWVGAVANRGQVGVPGLGSSAHFAILELGKALSVSMNAVAYKGSLPLLADEMGGHVPAGMDSLGSKLSHYKQGKVNLLAVTGARRTELAPDVPTFNELGVMRGTDFPTGWYGAFVAANTPPAEVARLSNALRDAVRDPDIRKQLESHGVEVTGSTPAELKAAIDAERRFWKPVVAASGFIAE